MTHSKKIETRPLAGLSLCIALLSIGSIAELSADSFDIGGSEIEVPVPAGFVLVTEEMAAVERLAAQMSDPMNDQLAYYVTEADAPTARGGELPPLVYTCILKVNKRIKAANVSPNDFAELKRATRRVNQQMIDEVKSKLGDEFEKISENISGEFDVDFAMQLSDIVPLDPHLDEANAFGYSMYIKYADATEQGELSVVAASVAMVNASGKVLFLYAYAPESDLESTRKTSSAWADAVLAANSAPPSRSSGAPGSGGDSGFDWQRIVKMAIIGAIVGGVIGGIGALKRRRESNG